MGISIDKALNITTKEIYRITPHIIIDNLEEITKYNMENIETLNTLVMCTKKYQKIQEIIADWESDGGAFEMSESHWLKLIRDEVNGDGNNIF